MEHMSDFNSIFKVLDIKSIVNDMDKPHHQKLSFNVENITETLELDRILYDQELQDSLLCFEKYKMPITVNGLCFNKSPSFKNNGGNIRMGISIIKEDSASSVINSNLFSKLKSWSVYDKYIFDNIKGDDILSVYDKLYYLLPNLEIVKTYTIVYITGDYSIREVTKHDFGCYGNILTKLDLKL